jgi:2-amino-4-hydroxy-6-hydroxymethyldihydropteridine diphosphokinase
MNSAGISLGSNLGDRFAQIEAGFSFLQSISASGRVLRSAIIESVPQDCPPNSGLFLNAVGEIDFAGTPRELMAGLQQYERLRGRPPVRATNSPRLVDLDILYFGPLIIDEPGLVIPHPRILERRFVLVPLAEIRPHLVLPGQTLTVQALRDRIVEQKAKRPD